MSSCGYAKCHTFGIISSSSSLSKPSGLNSFSFADSLVVHRGSEQLMFIVANFCWFGLLPVANAIEFAVIFFTFRSSKHISQVGIASGIRSAAIFLHSIPFYFLFSFLFSLDFIYIFFSLFLFSFFWFQFNIFWLFFPVRIDLKLFSRMIYYFGRKHIHGDMVICWILILNGISFAWGFQQDVQER